MAMMIMTLKGGLVARVPLHHQSKPQGDDDDSPIFIIHVDYINAPIEWVDFSLSLMPKGRAGVNWVNQQLQHSFIEKEKRGDKMMSVSV